MEQPKTTPETIRLPQDEEVILREEVSASGRSRNSIVLEALRLRRSVLEALGIQAAGTEPEEIARTAVRLIKAGLKAEQAKK